MNIDDCFEFLNETGNTDFQIYEHVDGNWYILELDNTGFGYKIYNIDEPEIKLDDVTTTSLENSEEWCVR